MKKNVTTTWSSPRKVFRRYFLRAGGRRCLLVAIYTRSDRSELQASTYSFVVRSLKRREKRIEFESHSSILKLDSYNNGTDNPSYYLSLNNLFLAQFYSLALLLFSKQANRLTMVTIVFFISPYYLA